MDTSFPFTEDGSAWNPWARCIGDDGFEKADIRAAKLVMSEKESQRVVMGTWPENFQERELHWNPHAIIQCENGFTRADDRVLWFCRKGMTWEEGQRFVMSEWPTVFQVESNDLVWNGDTKCTCSSGTHSAWKRAAYLITMSYLNFNPMPRAEAELRVMQEFPLQFRTESQAQEFGFLVENFSSKPVEILECNTGGRATVSAKRGFRCRSMRIQVVVNNSDQTKEFVRGRFERYKVVISAAGTLGLAGRVPTGYLMQLPDEQLMSATYQRLDNQSSLIMPQLPRQEHPCNSGEEQHTDCDSAARLKKEVVSTTLSGSEVDSQRVPGPDNFERSGGLEEGVVGAAEAGEEIIGGMALDEGGRMTALGAGVMQPVAAATHDRSAAIATEFAKGLDGLRSVMKPSANGNLAGGVEGNHGYLFEQHQAASFNIDAARQGLPHKASVLPVKNNFGRQFDLVVKNPDGTNSLFQAKARSNNAQAIRHHTARYGRADMVTTNDGRSASRPLTSQDRLVNAESVSTADIKASPHAAEQQLKQQTRVAQQEVSNTAVAAAGITTAFAVVSTAISSTGRLACQVQRGEKEWRDGVKDVVCESALAGCVTGVICGISVVLPHAGMVLAGTLVISTLYFSPESLQFNALRLVTAISFVGFCSLVGIAGGPLGMVVAAGIGMAIDAFCGLSERSARKFCESAGQRAMLERQKKMEPLVNDLLRLLGLPPDASDEEVNKQYRKWALYTHPDKAPDEQSRRRYQTEFETITAAKELIFQYRRSCEVERHETDRHDDWLTYLTSDSTGETAEPCRVLQRSTEGCFMHFHSSD
eukprot:2551020-Rhodomonas_salina.1